ncbi:MAG TPA: superoxide dismutase [Caulobacteraceae bacterium]|jgi:Fe-Mn family superoxide dismutase
MFALPNLPYAYDALEPTISERTLHYHHDKHHGTYVKTLNELIEKSGKSPASLEDVIRDAAKAGKEGIKLFNNAAQAWNHGFFWNCMTASVVKPDGELAEAIQAAFGETLAETFIEQGAAHFGSGWVWLVADAGGKLSVKSTHDAEDMVTVEGRMPLLVCDLWEHAYYLDYQNDRKAFLSAWFKALPNWSFAADQYAAARGDGKAWRYPPPAGRTGVRAA